MKANQRKSSGGRMVFGLVVAAMIVSAAVYFIRSGHASQPASAAQPPVPVTTLILQEQQVRVWSPFSGRLAAVNSAEIRPEVSGRITKVMFQDGQPVKAGDVLFVIDPRPYEAAEAKAEAELATAKSNANFAVLEQKRADSMMKSQAIAQRLVDERGNARRVAAAAVKSAEAQVKQAKVDMDHAYVKSPINGRAGRVELTVGNVVQSGSSAPLLTTVVSNAAVYADFEVDEQTYMQTIRRYASQRNAERKIPVQLTLQGDDAHPYEGTIYSFDNRLNATSGTIRARAKFPNKDGALLPGMFVSVKLASGSDAKNLLLPESAISFDQSKKYVYIVGPENKVEYREVTVGDRLGGNRLVLTGVKPGDRIVVEGVQHVRPGAVVDPKEAEAKKTVVAEAAPKS